MNRFECFADDCDFGTGHEAYYAQHLFQIHTSQYVDVSVRYDEVRRIMHEQGVPREQGPMVPGGMRRIPYDHDTGDIW